MEPQSGRKGACLVDQLFDDPCRFDFFQAVRLLEWLSDQLPSRFGSGERSNVGFDLHPSAEPVRFRAHPSQSFPPSPIADVRYASEGADRSSDGSRLPEMTVSFMGLTGPQGVLPDHYTRLLIGRTRDNDHAMREFFDLFNHRIISLFYRAGTKYRIFIEYERAARNGASAHVDPITHAFYCLIGFGTPHLRSRLELNDQTLLYFSGHVTMRRPIAASLELMLREYFGIRVEVEQFRGRWLSLSRDDRSRIGSPAAGNGTHHRLGDNILIGRRVWDVQGKFRLRLGPLDYAQFCSFLPPGRSFVQLCELVRLYVGPEFDFDVQLVLVAAQVPRCRLSGDSRERKQLGWNTWLCGQAMQEDSDQAVFAGDGASIHRNTMTHSSF